MKKLFAFVLAGILAIGTCTVVFAAPLQKHHLRWQWHRMARLTVYMYLVQLLH